MSRLGGLFGGLFRSTPSTSPSTTTIAVTPPTTAVTPPTTAVTPPTTAVTTTTTAVTPHRATRGRTFLRGAARIPVPEPPVTRNLVLKSLVNKRISNIRIRGPSLITRVGNVVSSVTSLARTGGNLLSSVFNRAQPTASVTTTTPSTTATTPAAVTSLSTSSVAPESKENAAESKSYLSAEAPSEASTTLYLSEAPSEASTASIHSLILKPLVNTTISNIVIESTSSTPTTVIPVASVSLASAPASEASINSLILKPLVNTTISNIVIESTPSVRRIQLKSPVNENCPTINIVRITKEIITINSLVNESIPEIRVIKNQNSVVSASIKPNYQKMYLFIITIIVLLIVFLTNPSFNRNSLAGAVTDISKTLGLSHKEVKYSLDEIKSNTITSSVSPKKIENSSFLDEITSNITTSSVSLNEKGSTSLVPTSNVTESKIEDQEVMDKAVILANTTMDKIDDLLAIRDNNQEVIDKAGIFVNATMDKLGLGKNAINDFFNYIFYESKLDQKIIDSATKIGKELTNKHLIRFNEKEDDIRHIITDTLKTVKKIEEIKKEIVANYNKDLQENLADDELSKINNEIDKIIAEGKQKIRARIDAYHKYDSPVEEFGNNIDELIESIRILEQLKLSEDNSIIAEAKKYELTKSIEKLKENIKLIEESYNNFIEDVKKEEEYKEFIQNIKQKFPKQHFNIYDLDVEELKQKAVTRIDEIIKDKLYKEIDQEKGDIMKNLEQKKEDIETAINYSSSTMTMADLINVKKQIELFKEKENLESGLKYLRDNTSSIENLKDYLETKDEVEFFKNQKTVTSDDFYILDRKSRQAMKKEFEEILKFAFSLKLNNLLSDLELETFYNVAHQIKIGKIIKKDVSDVIKIFKYNITQYPNLAKYKS